MLRQMLHLQLMTCSRLLNVSSWVLIQSGDDIVIVAGLQLEKLFVQTMRIRTVR